MGDCRAFLKSAFYEMYVAFCGGFAPNEGDIAALCRLIVGRIIYKMGLID